MNQSDYIEILIPALPPGVNRTYIHKAGGGVTLTKDARDWDKGAALIVGSADRLINEHVRVYDLKFNGQRRENLYFEGVVIGRDIMFPEIYRYVINKVVLPSGEAPHSWKVGTVGEFNMNYRNFDFMQPKQLRLL